MAIIKMYKRENYILNFLSYLIFLFFLSDPSDYIGFTLGIQYNLDLSQNPWFNHVWKISLPCKEMVTRSYVWRTRTWILAGEGQYWVRLREGFPQLFYEYVVYIYTHRYVHMFILTCLTCVLYSCCLGFQDGASGKESA